MYELIIVGIWGLVIIGSLILAHAIERREWQADRKDMLNRIMARTYQEYSEGQVKSEAKKPMRVISLDELRSELEEEKPDRLGMPV